MKYVRYIAALVLCCMLLFLAGCVQTAGPRSKLPEPSFAEGEPHRYHQGVFRDWFQTMASTAGPCTVSIRDTVYDEEQAVEWWYVIQADLASVYKTLNMAEDTYMPFTVYVVDKTPDGVCFGEGYLYCTPEDILSGGYRKGLVGAVLGDVESWKMTGLMSMFFNEEPEKSFLSGLKSIVFGEEETDAERLAAYLESGRNTQFLGLYAPYFCEDFAGELGVTMARIASRLLCEHVIAEHGGEMLLEDACTGCRQELLNELGLEHTYVDNFGDFDSGFTYSSSEDYSLVVATERGDVFNIVPLPDGDGEVATPEEVCWLLYDAWKGPQVIFEAIRAEAPECAEILERNFSTPFTCNLKQGRYGSITDQWTREIELGGSMNIIHEIVHIFLPNGASRTEWWKYEACAEYLTYKYYPGYSRNAFAFDSFTPENLGTLKTPNIYLAHAGLPQTMDEVDELLHLKAKVAASHLTYSEEEYAEQLPSIALEYSDINKDPAYQSIIPNEGGNALTYDELGTFADYLIEHYSLSTFLEYCLAADSTTFEETYGDFETIKAAWLEDLMSLADGLEFDKNPKT